MLKSIATVAASTAALAAFTMTPAVAAPKAPQTEDSQMFAPTPVVDVVEHRGHRWYGYRFYSGNYAYSPCYWGWRYGRKVWICY
jgi:hypothetical protein